MSVRRLQPIGPDSVRAPRSRASALGTFHALIRMRHVDRDSRSGQSRETGGCRAYGSPPARFCVATDAESADEGALPQGTRRVSHDGALMEARLKVKIPKSFAWSTFTMSHPDLVLEAANRYTSDPHHVVVEVHIRGGEVARLELRTSSDAEHRFRAEPGTGRPTAGLPGPVEGSGGLYGDSRASTTSLEPCHSWCRGNMYHSP